MSILPSRQIMLIVTNIFTGADLYILKIHIQAAMHICLRMMHSYGINASGGPSNQLTRTSLQNC